MDPGIVNLYFYTLREPNNYIKRASALFSSFSVVRPTQFFGIIKQQRKEKEKETTRFNLFDLNNSFDLKDEHYNNISRGSVVYLFCGEIDHHTFAILSLFRFGDHVLFSLRNRRLEVVGARKNEARERDTRIFSRARSALYVAGTCFTSTFPQLRSPPPSCQPREK